MDIVELLKQQAQEIAEEGHFGWGNTMTWAAEEIEKLRAAQQSVQPTGGTVAPANIEQRPEVDSAGEDNQRPATSR